MSAAYLAAAAAGTVGGLALAELWAVAPEPGAVASGGRRLPARVPPRAPLIVAAAAVGWALAGLIGVPVGGALAFAAGRRAGDAARARARRARERGVGALARSLADAIRGGRSIRAAVHFAAADRAVATALRATLQRLDAGLARGTTLDAALTELRAAGGPQLTLLAAVVALHAERGGPLARELDRLADDADHAIRVDEERAAATAQARATVRTVAMLPLLALTGAQLLGGDFLGSVVRHPAALALLIAGLLLEAVAVLVSRRLVARAA